MARLNIRALRCTARRTQGSGDSPTAARLRYGQLRTLPNFLEATGKACARWPAPCAGCHKRNTSNCAVSRARSGTEQAGIDARRERLIPRSISLQRSRAQAGTGVRIWYL